MPEIVSVVVPVYNEEGSAVQVAREIDATFTQHFGADGYEIIFVDDSSTDATFSVLNDARASIPNLRVLHHEKNVGKSGAIRTAVFAARGDVFVTLDGDGQNPPEDAARMIEILRAAGPDVGMVAGQRRNRQDTASRKWASRWANGIRKWALNDKADDAGCGLKAIRRNVFLRLPYFDQIHRYFPSMVTREGFEILFETVDDRLRTTGHSKYTNLGRLAVAMVDLPGVMWLNRRLRKPGTVREGGK